MTEDAGIAAERERLARQLRETRMQLAMTETRLAALEQSSTMKFGRTIANAAKKPWPKGALLPRELYRIWKDRGAPKSGAKNAATALAAAQLADLSGTGGRFLSSLTAPGVLALADPALALAGGLTAAPPGPGPGLVITGAISALGCATLAPDAVVHPLLPHDADVLIEGTGADLVLIEAAALLPGAAVGVRDRPGRGRPRPAAGPADRDGPLPRQARGPGAERAGLADAGPRLARGRLRRGDRRRPRRAARPVQPDRRHRRPGDLAGLRRAARPARGARRAGAARLADRRRQRRRRAGAGDRRALLAVAAGPVPRSLAVRHRLGRPGQGADRQRRAGDRADRLRHRRGHRPRPARGGPGRPPGRAWPRSGSGCGTSSPSTRRPPGWPTSSAPPISPATWCAGGRSPCWPRSPTRPRPGGWRRPCSTSGCGRPR